MNKDKMVQISEGLWIDGSDTQSSAFIIIMEDCDGEDQIVELTPAEIVPIAAHLQDYLRKGYTIHSRVKNKKESEPKK